MSTRVLAVLAVLVGAGVAGFGWYLTRRVRAEATFAGIGGFRVSLSGLAWYAGYLLAILGVSTVSVGIILLVL